MKQALLQPDPTTRQPQFINMIQFNSNCITLLAKKSNETTCLSSLHWYFFEYISTLDLNSKSRITKLDRPPVIHGTSVVPKQVQIYPKSRSNYTSPIDSDASTFTTPPPMQHSYAASTQGTTKSPTFTATAFSHTSPLSNSTQLDNLLQKINQTNNKQQQINVTLTPNTSQLKAIVTELANSYQTVQNTMVGLQSQCQTLMVKLKAFKDIILQHKDFSSQTSPLNQSPQSKSIHPSQLNHPATFDKVDPPDQSTLT